MDEPGARVAPRGGVPEVHLHAIDDRLLQVVEQRRRPTVTGPLPPRRRVDDERRGRRLGIGPERLGQRPHVLPQRRLDLGGRRRRRPRHQEERSRLGRGQPAEIGPGTPEELPPSVAPLARIHRQTGRPERLEVATCSALGDLQLGRDLSRRHLRAGLQEHEDGDEPICAHEAMFARQTGQDMTGSTSVPRFGDSRFGGPHGRARCGVPNRTASTLLSLLLVIVAVGCGTADEDKVGLIGDSITDLSREPLTQALGEDRVVEIVGKFGARSDQVIEDVKVIAASEPAAAIINIGTNDALQQVPAAQTAANIQQILDLLGDVGCRYLVQINTGITDTATAARPRRRLSTTSWPNSPSSTTASRSSTGTARSPTTGATRQSPTTRCT